MHSKAVFYHVLVGEQQEQWLSWPDWTPYHNDSAIWERKKHIILAIV